MFTETQAFLAMSTEDSELPFYTCNDLCFECTSDKKQGISTKHQFSSSSLTSSDKSLFEKSIDKQPDFSSDSYCHPFPNSPLSSNQEILQTDDFNKKTAEISYSASLEVRHERDATSDERLSDTDISLIPDPLPDYSHLVQRGSFTSSIKTQRFKTRIASRAALSSAALLSSMVDDDLCQYKYAQEWLEKQKALKKVPKVTFLKRIINAFQMVPLRGAADRELSSTSEENANKTSRHSIPLYKSPSVPKKKENMGAISRRVYSVTYRCN
jgi:hypothetical protein